LRARGSFFQPLETAVAWRLVSSAIADMLAEVG